VDHRPHVREAAVDQHVGLPFPGKLRVVQQVIAVDPPRDDVLGDQLPVSAAPTVARRDIDKVTTAGTDISTAHIRQSPLEHQTSNIGDLLCYDGSHIRLSVPPDRPIVNPTFHPCLTSLVPYVKIHRTFQNRMTAQPTLEAIDSCNSTARCKACIPGDLGTRQRDDRLRTGALEEAHLCGPGHAVSA